MTDRKRRGRPTKPATEGKRVSLGLKVTPQTKARLDEAARLHGRTQSQEAEYRLERSFLSEDLLFEVLTLTFGREFAGLLLLMGLSMFEAGRFSYAPPLYRGQTFLTEPYCYDQVQRAAVQILQALKPDGAPTPPDGWEAGGNWGDAIATMMIRALMNDPRAGLYQEDAAKIRELLGPLLHQLREPNDHEGEHHPPRKE
jgi:hypothetical protein